MSNYIELQLGGEKRGLKFNNAAVDTYWQKVNFKEVAASYVYAAVYAGLIGNDIAKGVQNSLYDYEQVTEWVDELYDNDEAALKRACDVFESTTSYQKRLEKIQDKVRALQVEGEEKKSLA